VVVEKVKLVSGKKVFEQAVDKVSLAAAAAVVEKEMLVFDKVAGVVEGFLVEEVEELEDSDAFVFSVHSVVKPVEEEFLKVIDLDL
jgi:hypothetical protein